MTTENMMRTTDGLGVAVFGRTGADVATKAAVRYLRKNGLTADPDVLANSLVEHVRKAVDEAVTDIQEALACGMQDVAMMMFGAMMALVGVEAAQECGVRQSDEGFLTEGTDEETQPK